jgi:beta-lactamase regulating signal transducer with metallopeptidase domain
MTDFIQHPVVQALAWALVHFVWQGTAIGLAAFLALRVARPVSTRYAIGVGALALMLAAPVATFVILTSSRTTASSQQRPVSAPVAPAPAQPPAAARLDDSASAVLPSTPLRVSPEMLAIAVMSWIGGVAFFSISLFGGWVVARRLARHGVTPAADYIQRMARELSARLQVRRVVEILESTTTAVPVMIGWLKPAIVLPVAALASLSPSQLEALLAHELAHVRRHDYLVNVLQSMAEALLFYHPAVWWMSRQIRTEREHCCDDLAVGVCDRLVYATALTDLATLASPRVALAATDGNLVKRVRRILRQADETASVRAGLMPLLALGLAACVAVPVALASGAGSSSVTADQPAAISQPTEAASVVQPADEAVAETESAEPQQSAEQVARQQQVEELKRRIEELQKALAQLAQERTPEMDARRQQEVLRAVEAQQKMASANREEVAKLAEKMKQVQTEQQKRAMEASLADLAIRQDELKRRAADQTRTARTAEERARTSEWEAAQRAYLDAQSRFEKGLITQAQLREYEAAVKRAEAAGDPQALRKAELADAERNLARANAQFERGLMSQAQFEQVELAFRKMQASGDLAAQARIEMEVAQKQLERVNELVQKGLVAPRDVEQAKRDMQELQQRLVERRVEVNPDARRGAMAPAADQNQALKRGDILRITVQGEPDLPSTYEVTADGTIRIPFLGATKVAGLTAADVRTAVGKQLADRKLGDAARVTVTLMRR